MTIAIAYAQVNTTGNQRTTHFVGEPPGRGTLGLVWSCLVTIFLCIFAFQRLNITEHPLTDLLVLHRKVLWMLITLLLLEYTALCAFN